MFAKAREIAGASQVKITIDTPAAADQSINQSQSSTSNNQTVDKQGHPARHPITVNQLVNQLIKAYPGLSELVNSMMMAVNMEYERCDSTRLIDENDEIAVIPPISGG